MTASRFFMGNRESGLKPTTFSLVLLFRVFLSFHFSLPPGGIAPFVCCLLGYCLIIIIYGKGSWFHMLGGQSFRDRVMYVNVSGIPTFVDSGSLGYPPR